MKCPSEIELNEFAEDRLDSRRRWEVQEHLTQCAGCRADLEGLQWAGEQLAVLETALPDEQHPAEQDLAALAEGKASPDRKAELLSHLSNCAECAWLFGRLPRKSRKLAVPMAWYSYAAAAVILVAVGLFAFNGLSGNHQGPTLAPPAKVAAVKPAKQMAASPAQTPKPVAVATAPAPPATAAPTQIAQTLTPAVTPKPAMASVAVAPKPVIRHGGGAGYSRHSAAPRRGRHEQDNMQIAMNLPAPAPVPTMKALTEEPRDGSRAKPTEDKVFAIESRPHVAVAQGMPGAGAGGTHTMAAMGVRPNTGTTRGPAAAVEPAAPAAVAAPGHVAVSGAAPQAPRETRQLQPVKKTPVGVDDPRVKRQAKVAHSKLRRQELAALKQSLGKASMASTEGKAQVKRMGQVGQRASGQRLAHGHHHHGHATHLAHATAHHHMIAQHAPPGHVHA